MKHLKKYLILTSTFFIIGCAFFLIQKRILIVLWNKLGVNKQIVSAHLKGKLAIRKKVCLYLREDGKLNSEELSMVWLSDDLENLKHIVTHWLGLMYQEQIIDKKILLKSSALSESKQEVYLSFDKSPLSSQWSIEKKWMFIEGLLKTLREVSFNFNKIFFMVDYQPLEDDHLDFSQGWQIDGFLKEG